MGDEPHGGLPGAFCVLPWVHVYGAVDGIWGRCCVDASTFNLSDRGELSADAIGCARGSPHAAVNATRVLTLTEAFNSAEMRRTRQAMLKGERVHACEYCYAREAAGARSYRQIANGLFLNDAAVRETIADTTNDGAIGQFPLYLDVRLGNTCNLACVMCSETASSTIAIRNGTPPAEARIEAYSEDEGFWQTLEANAPAIRRVYLAGGEPLLNRMHFRLLDLLIAHGRPEATTVAYSTNLSLVPEGWLDRLQRFQTVDIGASCDGVEEVFERIRAGARWEVFQRNVRRVRDLFPVRIAVTAQRDNICHLPALIEWALAERCTLDLSNILLYPVEMSISALPIDARQELWAMYRRLSSHYAAGGYVDTARELDDLAAVLQA